MSQRGLKLFAAALAQLQTLEHELTAIGSAEAKTPAGKQDLILGRLAAKAREAVNRDFVNVTLDRDVPPPNKRRRKKQSKE